MCGYFYPHLHYIFNAGCRTDLFPVPELKYPWKVDRVSLDSKEKIVEVHISHDKGAKLPCPECRKECMVYDHLGERVWRDLGSIGFRTFIHAKPPRTQCPEHGIKEAVMPLSERRSRFTLRFEPKSIRMLQNMDIYNFTQVMYMEKDGVDFIAMDRKKSSLDQYYE
jgi:transposase